MRTYAQLASNDLEQGLLSSIVNKELGFIYVEVYGEGLNAPDLSSGWPATIEDLRVIYDEHDITLAVKKSALDRLERELVEAYQYA